MRASADWRALDWRRFYANPALGRAARRSNRFRAIRVLVSRPSSFRPDALQRRRLMSTTGHTTRVAALAAALLLSPALIAQATYDLVLKGGHVIDPRNNLSAVRDIGITGGRVAAVAANIPAAAGREVVNV